MVQWILEHIGVTAHEHGARDGSAVVIASLVTSYHRELLSTDFRDCLVAAEWVIRN